MKEDPLQSSVDAQLKGYLSLYDLAYIHDTTEQEVLRVWIEVLQMEPKTVQVKSNLKAKPAGGRGKAGLDWWVLHGDTAGSRSLSCDAGGA